MPGTRVARNELQHAAVAPDEEVRGHPQAAQTFEIGVRSVIEGVGEEALDAIATVVPRRQADGVQHGQSHAFAGRPRAKIG